MASTPDGLDLLVLLLDAPGPHRRPNEPIHGITRLQKLLYLLEREEDLGSIHSFTFEPYRFGPFAQELYDALEFLESNGFLEIDEGARVDHFATMESQAIDPAEEVLAVPERVYMLSERGLRLATALRARTDARVMAALERLKSKYGGLSLTQLIRYVYSKYPESAVNSELTHLKS